MINMRFLTIHKVVRRAQMLDHQQPFGSMPAEKPNDIPILTIIIITLLRAPSS